MKPFSPPGSEPVYVSVQQIRMHWLRYRAPWVQPCRRIKNRILYATVRRRVPPSEAEMEREAQFQIEQTKRMFARLAALDPGPPFEPPSHFLAREAERARDDRMPGYVADMYERAARRAAREAFPPRRAMQQSVSPRPSGETLPANRARESRPQRRTATRSSSSGGGDPPDDPEPEPPLVRGLGIARGRLGVEGVA